jgi:hypothetical protein
VARRPFKRVGSTGEVVVTLPALDCELLRQLGTQVRALLTDVEPGDPVYERMFPRAYLDPTEEAAEDQWQRYLHADLVDARVKALDELVAALDRGEHHGTWLSTTLSPDEVDRWLAALNDARLALGTRLGVEEDRDVEGVPEDDPDRPAWELYDWLTWLQVGLLHALGW